MKIEEGKYYRMRCGGAVKIECLSERFAKSNLAEWWLVDCESRYNQLLDLVAEITEAEYNRIVSGDARESAVLDTAESKMMEMHTEIETLKDELEAVQMHLEAAKHNASVWEYRATDRGYAEETDSLRARLSNLEQDKAQLTRERDVLAFNFARAVTKDRRFEAAKAAMQGMLDNIQWQDLPEHVADNAIIYADALIKALEKRK